MGKVVAKNLRKTVKFLKRVYGEDSLTRIVFSIVVMYGVFVVFDLYGSVEKVEGVDGISDMNILKYFFEICIDKLEK